MCVIFFYIYRFENFFIQLCGSSMALFSMVLVFVKEKRLSMYNMNSKVCFRVHLESFTVFFIT